LKKTKKTAKKYESIIIEELMNKYEKKHEQNE